MNECSIKVVRHPDAIYTVSGDNIELSSRYGNATLSLADANTRAIIEAMLGSGWNIVKLGTSKDLIDFRQDAFKIYLVQQLTKRRLVAYSVFVGSNQICKIIPSLPDCDAPTLQLAAINTRSSRFLYVSRVDNTWLIQSPLTSVSVSLHNKAALSAVHSLLNRGSTNHQTTEKKLNHASVLKSVLYQYKFLTDSPCDIEEMPQWEFHDLLFHAKTRAGYHGSPIGATNRLVGLANLTPRNYAEQNDCITLPDPADTVRKCNQPFFDVVERRRSCRMFTKELLDIGKISALLFFTFREKVVYRDTSSDALERDRVETSFRPIPTAGGLSSLRIYVYANRVKNVTKGLYYYDSQEHRLLRREFNDLERDKIVYSLRGSTKLPSDPQLVILITANILAKSWRYESIAYSLILKDLGVLYQSLYVTATALNLGGCALGTGDSVAFARLANIDINEEPLVGEFMIGIPHGMA